MRTQLPLSLHGARKSEVRTQFAALCYRVKKGKVQVLLVTSRRSRRWIVPKGWPMDGKTPEASALQEAWEEAGVNGKVAGPCVGIYSYAKDIGEEDDLACLAIVYPIAVKSLSKKFPEVGQRKRRWVSRKKAARLVQEPDLGRLIVGFDPTARNGRA